MAEAIKPVKSSEQVKSAVPMIRETERKADQLEEITDKSLEKRLKSLTSFINNIEPEAKQVIQLYITSIFNSLIKYFVVYSLRRIIVEVNENYDETWNAKVYLLKLIEFDFKRLNF